MPVLKEVVFVIKDECVVKPEPAPEEQQQQGLAKTPITDLERTRMKLRFESTVLPSGDDGLSLNSLIRIFRKYELN